MTVTAYGTWTVPWLVFRHFLDAIEASGDIVEVAPVAEHSEPPPPRDRSGQDHMVGRHADAALVKTHRTPLDDSALISVGDTVHNESPQLTAMIEI